MTEIDLIDRGVLDGLLQSLTAARLQLHRLTRSLGAGSEADTRTRLSAIEKTLTENQRELRLLVEDLRQPFALPLVRL